ncbi:DNA polymerase interacting tetratricopeptide repeat-containing, protein of 47 kDa-like [Nilaparvata lugens]|uniref:DNA polymerase interacting tetratricopeptide repeat-containing, protein of 47 kDa-like n=1 Tax=Nilaparvata lugens TaxID=108931 RepID=UPI00193D2EF9|nr:DNA polymerase interacting tetratricopeptide repeat-containing, protein of 47 kDa-like [Nilaparvata lugens]
MSKTSENIESASNEDIFSNGGAPLMSAGDSSAILGDSAQKKVWTDEERKELAAKLDDDLDTYISGLEKRQYTEGWPEDRWQEEMEKHPFFMTKAPGVNDELSPLMQGLQELKYSTTENTPEELAATYKEDGNFNFKCKKYRFAIVSYTEGLRLKCQNADLNAQLYNNRGACHYFLKNYRSCINDCLNALKINPDYMKASIRLANCYFYVEDYNKCMEVSASILLKEPTNEEIIGLKTKAFEKKKAKISSQGKKAYEEMKVSKENKRVVSAVRERGIKLLGSDAEITEISQLVPLFSEVVKRPVHLENDRLVWPVIFLYPEYATTDFVQEFHEDSLFSEQLVEMFSDPPEWDVERKYTPDKINVYYEDPNSKPQKVSKTSTLGMVLSRKNLYIRVQRNDPFQIEDPALGADLDGFEGKATSGVDAEITEISQLVPLFSEVVKRPVHLENDRLVWPVIFLYPEYATTDFVQEFHEDSLFSEQLVEMFSDPPEWDVERKYTPDKINVYYEDPNSKPQKVSKTSTLGMVLSRKNYRVDQGTPAFTLFSEGSPAEQAFLKG